MTKKLHHNAADEVEIKSAKDREQLRSERDKEDLRFLLTTKQGRRYVYRKVCECGIFSINTNTNSQIYVREGQRAVGLLMLEEVTAIDPDLFSLMMKEAKDDDLAS